ncbi:MAG: hypothetical protein IPP35_11260 [Elusimicrobia bacterium]|nr:hypothetical protein [Elusimicrobiota bacterium]
MFGNNPDRGDAPRPGDWLDVLGRLSAEPAAALEEIARKPHLISGALVTGLAVIGRVITENLPWELGPFPVLRRFLSLFLGGFLWWVGPAVVLHGLSALFKKKGSLASYLAVTGWAGATLWPALAFRLVGGLVPGAMFLAAGPELVFRALYWAIWWWGLQRLYGWSKGRALLLLVLPLFAFGAIGFVTRLLAGLVGMGRALTAPSLLP